MIKLFLTATAFVFSVNAFAQQTLQLKSGEKLNGKVETLNNGIVTFAYKGITKNININDIYSITFGEVGESGGESKAATPHEVGEKQVTSGSYLVRYKVADRSVSRPPKIDNLTQEKGTVVVDISIDKYGHVMKATPGAPGSTTTSEYLKTKAKQAAESALFNNVPTAPLEQSGYMIIVF